MPTLDTQPPRKTRKAPTTEIASEAILGVRALFSRSIPWTDEDVLHAARAIGNLLTRWENYQRAYPGQGGVEMSPYLEGAVEALREALAAAPSVERS